jgi:hypothetical protein
VRCGCALFAVWYAESNSLLLILACICLSVVGSIQVLGGLKIYSTERSVIVVVR